MDNRMCNRQTSTFAPDAQKASLSARSIFAVMDRTSPIDSQATTGSEAKLAATDITFENVAFAYPTRRDVPVYRGLNLHIKAGQRVALVGPSGCGKSTAISMLLRFYNPDAGRILIGDRDIGEFNIKSLRGQFGLVSQEPVLFATSILENIRYRQHTVGCLSSLSLIKRTKTKTMCLLYFDGARVCVCSSSHQVRS